MKKIKFIDFCKNNNLNYDEKSKELYREYRLKLLFWDKLFKTKNKERS